jgi:hypothetical protein
MTYMLGRGVKELRVDLPGFQVQWGRRGRRRKKKGERMEIPDARHSNTFPAAIRPTTTVRQTTTRCMSSNNKV